MHIENVLHFSLFCHPYRLSGGHERTQTFMSNEPQLSGIIPNTKAEWFYSKHPCEVHAVHTQNGKLIIVGSSSSGEILS